MLLLDTHVVLWVLDDNPRLGLNARKTIASDAAVHVSAATIWELTIKAMLGKLTVPDKLSSRIVEQGLVMLNVTAEHAEGLTDFPELARHDPFDRMLLAQAKIDGLRFLTADRVLLALGHGFVLDATE